MYTIELLEVKQLFFFPLLTIHTKKALLRDVNIGKKYFSKDENLTPY